MNSSLLNIVMKELETYVNYLMDRECMVHQTYTHACDYYHASVYLAYDYYCEHLLERIIKKARHDKVCILKPGTPQFTEVCEYINEYAPTFHAQARQIRALMN